MVRAPLLYGVLIVPPFALMPGQDLQARKRRFGLFIASIITIFVLGGD